MAEVKGDSPGGFGVEGTSQAGHGVVGRSAEGNGVIGHSAGNPAGGNAGVFGEHLNHGTGVVGKSQGGFGVFAESATGIAFVARGGQLAGRFEGDVEVTGDVRLANADCAEYFDVDDEDDSEPGTVMVLGEEGDLRCSARAYDKRVAGVISGAGCYKPGILLDNRGAVEGRRALALVGKVFCKVDASYGVVRIGDLLTTSATRGHAMRVSAGVDAFGAVIGKALGTLDQGRGLIPILVALH